jgi:predicted transcriptional regulator
LIGFFAGIYLVDNLLERSAGMSRKLMVVLSLMAVVLCWSSMVQAESLMAGMKASDWSFKDADGNAFSMESWAGKILLINYVDPDESDLNEHFTDAMKKAKDQGLLKEETYKGIGIVDCKATWKPDALIRTMAGKKAKKYNTTILFDYEAILRNAWGLEADTANAVLLDKNRVVRVIVRGKVPQSEVDSIVGMAIKIQDE